MNLVDEATMVAKCRTCTWNQNCISPPIMTKEEVEERVHQKVEASEEGKKSDPLFAGIMNVMIFGGKDKEAPVCAVLATRLRQSEVLSRKIKEIMQSWEA